MSIAKKQPPSQPSPSIEELARELIDKPDEWLDTKNDQLGGEKPRSLIGTPKVAILRNLLDAIRYGSFS